MYCTICTHKQGAEIVEDWVYSKSLRGTAERYGVGYRSLQRHLDLCVASIMAEREEAEYRAAFARTAQRLRLYFGKVNRRRQRKSIITKPVEFTWSRRSWKRKPVSEL